MLEYEKKRTWTAVVFDFQKGKTKSTYMSNILSSRFAGKLGRDPDANTDYDLPIF